MSATEQSLMPGTIPGPWYSHMLGGGKGGPNQYSVTTNKEWGGEEGVTHRTIATVHGQPDGSAGWNAKLIASAPDLYAACQAANRLCDALNASRPTAADELVEIVQQALKHALDQ